MPIDPKVEKHTRQMLGHAMRGELDELAALIHAAGDEVYRGVIRQCLLASGYISIDVAGRWPADADLRQIARNAAEAETSLLLGETDIYQYLSRSVLDDEPLTEVFPATDSAFTLPVLITASMLVTFCPRNQDWWEYLDVIWNGVNAADRTELSALPALMMRARRGRQMIGGTETA